jgi:uncharacterized protein (TIGR04255 family)
MISGRTGTTGVSDLASYSRPPVIEVALAVQFEPGTLSGLDAATFRGSIRETYPKYEEQPARPPVEEVFDPVIAAIPFRFEVLDAPQMHRVWFLNEDGSRLVQLQSDLLAVNWRRLTEGDEYPRYETLRADLEQYLGVLNDILQAEGRDTIRPNWCEVTYINQVAPEAPENPRPPLEHLLTVLSRPEGEFLPAPEDAFLRERFVIPGDDGPRGRLIVEAAPGYRNVDRVSIWNFTFTSRVRAVAEGDAGTLEALDLGREWAVRAFTEVISPEMQSQWGLQDEGG